MGNMGIKFFSIVENITFKIIFDDHRKDAGKVILIFGYFDEIFCAL